MLTITRIEREIAELDMGRLMKLKRYYDGRHDILRKEVEGNKPNNKLVHDFPSYIVDMFQGYFIGNPVVYTGKPELLKELQDILILTMNKMKTVNLRGKWGYSGVGVRFYTLMMI
jgi:SPP1 family phage portal protein